MGAWDFASIVENFNPSDATALSVVSGETFYCFGFTVSNTSAATARTFVIQTAEASPTTLFTANLSGQTDFIMDIPFKADKGLQVKNDDAGHSDLHYTVIRSQSGI
jgi:hypothetical protein